MMKLSIRGISLNVKIIGCGYPLVLMYGGPGADLHTMLPLKPLAKHFTMIFYDHRCNGHSTGEDITTMTMDNLTADADALRQSLGFDRWAVLGHSFGGYVALEYVLRYPGNLSHLLLIDSGGDYRWARENTAKVLEKRGFSPDIVELAQRHLGGQIEPREMLPALMKLGKAYTPHLSLRQVPHAIIAGVQTKLQPDAMIFGETQVLKNWNIMDRLSEISVPTLIIAGREDFIYPPESQEELVAAIPNARLVFIERAGHSPHLEQPAEVQRLIRDFLPADTSKHG
jgi:pimeloyl-ACP methyl ester carboxylesterase